MDKRIKVCAIALAVLALNACEDRVKTENGQDTGATEAYVVAGTTQDAAYILTSQSLDTGEVSSKGDGYETDYSRAATWVFFGDKYLYRLSYNMGQAGTTVAFQLDENGKISKRPVEYSIQNFTSYGICGDAIITSATAATDETDTYGNQAYGIVFSVIDTKAQTVGTMTVSAENFLGTGEYVMLAGLLESGGKIYAGVVPLGCSPYGVAAGGVRPGNEDLVQQSSGGSGGGSYTAGTLTGTQYPDECYVAIFDDTTFSNPVIARTDKMSWAAGRMRSAYYQTVWAADNGDVYVFSPSYAKLQSDARQQTVHPSSVMRIKAGTTTFDETYSPFDIEEASGGKEVYRCWHISGDYFLLQMYSKGINTQGTGTTEMAVFKGEDRSFRYVSGLPDPDVISSFPCKNPYSENGHCYVSVVTTDGQSPRIYNIDAATATAVPGLTTILDEAGAIGKLKSL